MPKDKFAPADAVRKIKTDVRSLQNQEGFPKGEGARVAAPKNYAISDSKAPEFSRVSAMGRNAAGVAAGALKGAKGRVPGVPGRGDTNSQVIQAKSGSILKSSRGSGVAARPSGRNR